jgi:hypothetical protein
MLWPLAWVRDGAGRRTRLEVDGSFDVVTFNLGIMAECLGGIEAGHRELPEWIDRWID